MAKLLVTLAIVCFSGIVVVHGNELLDACKRELGATDADVEQLLGEIDPVLTEQGKCLEACHMQKLGLMNSNGKFDAAAALALLKKNHSDQKYIKTVSEIANACVNIPVPGESCANALVYRKCLINESEKRHTEPI